MMKIAIAQLNYKLGDFSNNFQKIGRAIKEYANKADLIIFSELCLSGYYPKDLISQPGFIEAQDAYLQRLIHLTQETDSAIIVGVIQKNAGKGKPYHNSLCLISKGNILHSYHKRLLPVYNIFNEARHFAPGNTPGLYSFEGQKLGFIICEDGWAGLDEFSYECNPVDDFINQNLNLIICINGSPSNIGKQQDRLDQFSAIAKRCHAPLVFVNQVGGNDDIIFDGASFILDHNGNPIGQLPVFKESVGIFSLSQQQLQPQDGFESYRQLPDVELFYQQTILGLKDYIGKCGFKSVVLGLSGGIDSALTLVLAVQALGKENVAAIAMPTRYSEQRSLLDAQALCDAVGTKLHVYAIEDEFNLALKEFVRVFGEKANSITEQNIQARLRGRILMEFSNQTGALVISTGNKSELSVGYATLYGDMTGGFNLIGDLYKTDVYRLAQFYNQLHPQQAIPVSIMQRAPSAELAPNQKDTDSLPEYDILDPILKLYIEGDLLSLTEIEKYQQIEQNLPAALIEQVQQMVNRAEFKRRQAAPIVRVQRRAFGIGRQFPIAASYPKNI